MRSGHTFTPTPDGRYVIAETEYQYAPSHESLIYNQHLDGAGKEYPHGQLVRGQQTGVI